MKNMPLVSILIVTYNSSDYIKRCLDSLLKISYPRKEIIVVDNNSQDKTKEILSKYSKKIHPFFKLDNNGYTGGNNFGFKKTKGKYVFIINPDTKVEKNFLEPLVGEMEKNDEIGACQPLVYLYNDRKKINLTGKDTHFLGFDFIRNYLDTIPPGSGEITSFSGSGVLLRRSSIERVGLFDEEYFMYYEDGDLSWRIRLYGLKILFVPSSVIYHDYRLVPLSGGLTLKSKIFFNERNRLLNIFKNYKTKTIFLIIPIFLLMELGLIILSIKQHWFKEKISSYFSIISLIPHIKKCRRLIEFGRIVDDKNITKDFTSKITFKELDYVVIRYFVNPIMVIYWWIVCRII